MVHASPRTPGEIDGVINNALKRIGEFFAIERDFVFLFSEDGRTMHNTHEWAADGVEPQAQWLRNIPIDRYSWALERLRSGTPLVVDDVQDLPPEADAEKVKFIEQKVQSILAVPLVCDGRVMGYMGLHSVGRKVHWSEQTVRLVKVISEIVAGAVTRDRAERELRESEAQHRRLHEEKELLLREVYHRIRNNMATMQNLLQLRAQRLGNSPAAPILRAAAAQIQSMQSLYRRLHYTTDMHEIDLASYLSEVVAAAAAIAPEHVLVETDLAAYAMPVGPGRAFSVGIIVNELLTNGFKYAFPDGRAGGVIKIGLGCDGDNLCRLTYADNGVGIPPPNKETGFRVITPSRAASEAL